MDKHQKITQETAYIEIEESVETDFFVALDVFTGTTYDIRDLSKVDLLSKEARVCMYGDLLALEEWSISSNEWTSVYDYYADESVVYPCNHQF